MALIPHFELGRFRAVAIGSSTGGPGLVADILSGLPADLPAPIFIAQHLPPQFTPAFAAQLARASPLTVVHAESGMSVYPGTVYVAPGRQHLRVRRSIPMPGTCGCTVEVSPEPVAAPFKPSADELFESCAKVFGAATLAVVLTGIGRDGTRGAAAVRAAGGVVLSQSEATCAVYGMPRYVFEQGHSNAQLDPDDIRRAILQLSPQHRERAFVTV